MIFYINVYFIFSHLKIMTDMWWLKISCPICPANERGEPRYWAHSGCPKNYSSDNDVKIDIDGNIFCNGCHDKDPLIKWRFRCGKHDFERLTNIAQLTEVLQVMINMDKNMNNQAKYAKMIANVMNMFANSANN